MRRISPQRRKLCLQAIVSLIAVSVLSARLSADPVHVRQAEGAARGFLVVHSEDGRILGTGDIFQTVHRGVVTNRVVLHFRDGSVDDESTVFRQQTVFRLISDHRIQKGPSYPHPIDVFIDATTGQVTVKTLDKDDEKTISDHLDVPPDLYNGLMFTLVKDLAAAGAETKVSYLATTPKPRLIHVAISSMGKDSFTIAGSPYSATHYVLKPELGGVAGVVAPLIGKQPANQEIWVLPGSVPAVLKFRGSLFDGGPTWTIEQASPVWPKDGAQK